MYKYFWALLLSQFVTPLLAASTYKDIKSKQLLIWQGPQKKDYEHQLSNFSAKNSKSMLAVSNKHWGVLIYHSWMTNNNIGPILTAQSLNFKYGTMNSIDLSYQLDPTNTLRRFFRPLVSTIEIADNITQRHDPNGLIYEFDPYLNFRWKTFPWDHYVTTTFAIGDGFSYATGIPLREQHDSSNNNAKRLLNFLVVEATFAAPSHPDLQLVLRVNHRCGAWGLFGAGNLSSNAVGLGIRYLF
ncbi:MAG: hypothetical protein E6K54_04225 [Gammaproteobacteria bacterium]|nr:MAG: hypothetical protein E6K54_04225 [Gammaproteobacteria bacterium]